MILENYHALRAKHRTSFPRTREFNPLPSATDPTKECPVSAFQFGPDGSVINCVGNGLPFSGLTIEQMTSIESRHRDKFDILGEQQRLAAQASRGLNNSNVKQKKLD